MGQVETIPHKLRSLGPPKTTLALSTACLADHSHLQSCCTAQNAFKGDFSRKRTQGKRAVELGSGIGLGGMAFALLGCSEVVLTDVKEVLPLLTMNLNSNLTPAALQGEFPSWTSKLSLSWFGVGQFS